MPILMVFFSVVISLYQRGHGVATGPPLKVGERVMRVTPLGKAPLEQLLRGLNLGVQVDLDPDPENIVAVGTFTYTPPGQTAQQVAPRPLTSIYSSSAL